MGERMLFMVLARAITRFLVQFLEKLKFKNFAMKLSSEGETGEARFVGEVSDYGFNVTVAGMCRNVSLKRFF